MKRSILLSLAIIPMLFSCNNNDRGFVNPFPNDDYQVKGMDYQEDRAIVRTLSTDDKILIDNWRNDPKDEEITCHTIESNVRDYTLAFANKYRAGYDASNAMINNVSNIYKLSYDDPDTNEDDKIDYYETKKTVNAIYQYDFGENPVNDLVSYDYHYFANTQNSNDNVIKIAKRAAVESGGSGYFVNIQNYQEKKNDDETLPDATIKSEFKNEKWDPNPDSLIPTSQIAFTELDPSTISDLAGFDRDGNVVLVDAHQDPYNPTKEEHGFYTLPDGRKYVAVQKDLIVVKLELVKPTQNDEGESHYLINYVRTYKETSITSEEVQPNIPPKELSKPIIIHFEEDIHRFYHDNTITPESDIPPVPTKANLVGVQ